MSDQTNPVLALQLWTERRVVLACRAGLVELDDILDSIADQIPNGLGEDVSDNVVAALIANLSTNARAVFEARAADEATWSERTLTDRVEDVLANLEANGMITAKSTRWREQEDDLFDGSGGPEDPWEDKPGARWHWALLLHENSEGALVASGSIHDNEGSTTRDDDARKNGDAFIRVLAHHGFSASWNDKTREVEVGAFRFQKRRSSAMPDGTKEFLARAAAPEVCALCGGKGWLVTDPTKFPTRCRCKEARIKLL